MTFYWDQMALILGELVKNICSAARSNVWMLKGSEPNTGKELQVLFAGGEQLKSYVAKLIFNGKCRQSHMGKLYLPQIHYLLKCNRSNCALAFIEVRQAYRFLYEGRNDFYIPQWLESCVEIPLKASNKSAKEDLRRIRRHRLSYEFSEDMQSVKDFYENMYLPTIHDRHKNTGLSVSFEKFKDILARPDNKLMLINHEGNPIAGVIIQMQKIPRLWVAGIRDSSNDYRRMGAVGASFYFSAQYLSGLGYREMGFGRSRSFLHDGIVNYKSKWNHRFYDYDKNAMIVKVLIIKRGLSGFLTNQPFVSIRNGQLQANVFVDAMIQPNHHTSEEIEILRFDRGLSCVNVFAIDTQRGTLCRSNDR